MKDDDDDGDDDEKKIKRNGRRITRKRRRHVILGAVCHKTMCPICNKVMSAQHEVPCSFNRYETWSQDKLSAPEGKLGEYKLKKLKCYLQR